MKNQTIPAGKQATRSTIAGLDSAVHQWLMIDEMQWIGRQLDFEQ